MMRIAMAGMAVVLALGLAACDDQPDLKDEIVGKWELSDPGGVLVGGHVNFERGGRVTVVEVIRTASGPTERVMSGTYRFLDDENLRMELRQPLGQVSRQKVGVRLMDGRLTLMFHRGRVVYRRPI